MDNNKPLCELLTGDTTLDTFNNELSGGESYYRYPDKTLFQRAELQSVLHDITNNSSFANCEKPFIYPVHSPVATSPELNSALSTGILSELCLSPELLRNSKIYGSSSNDISNERSTKNNLQLNSTYNLCDRGKTNCKQNGKVKFSMQIHNSFSSKNRTEKSRLRHLQLTSHQMRHSGIFDTAFEINNMSNETRKSSNNSLKLLKDEDTDSLNSTNNMDIAYLRSMSNLSNNWSDYFHLLDSVIDCTEQNKTNNSVLKNNKEKLQKHDMNNVSLIPELNFENCDMIKEDDSSLLSTHLEYCSINTNEVPPEKLLFSTECNSTSSENSKNSVTQNSVQCRKNYIKNKPDQIRYILASTSENKETVQPFHPHNNNKTSNNINTRMLRSKSKPSTNAQQFVNKDEDICETTENVKITNHTTNMLQDEQFIINIKRRKQQQSSHILSANTNYNTSQTTKIIQSKINYMHNKSYTINCNKDRNHLDEENCTVKHCDSLTHMIRDVSSAVVSKELINEDFRAFLNNKTRLNNNPCFRQHSRNHSVISVDHIVNEKKTIRQSLKSKTNRKTKMNTQNTRLSKEMYKECCSTALTEKLKHQTQLADLREHLFECGFFHTGVKNRKLKLNIPFSELKDDKIVVMSIENPSTDRTNIINNNGNKQETTNIKQMNKNQRKSRKHVEWKTKSLINYVSSTLQPKYGIKSKIICSELMQFFEEKIKETVENDFDFHVPVNEIKKKLASLNIIKTNLDFYLFVLKYFRRYEPHFMFKSVPCIQTFGQLNLVPRPPKEYLCERILQNN